MIAANLKEGQRFNFNMDNRKSDTYKVILKNPQSLIVANEKGKERHFRNMKIPVEIVE